MGEDKHYSKEILRYPAIKAVPEENALKPWQLDAAAMFECICHCGGKFICFCGSGLKILKWNFLSSSVSHDSTFIVVNSFIFPNRTKQQ